MSIREKLIEIVGTGNFSDDPNVLNQYASDFSLVPAGAPSYVVKPKDAQEIGKVIKLANDHVMPVVPVSSEVHFNGATIPKQGGIVLDLARMKKVLEIDVDNRRVRIDRLRSRCAPPPTPSPYTCSRAVFVGVDWTPARSLTDAES